MLHFQILLHHFIEGIWNVVHNNIEVDLVRLIAISIERLLHFYTVRMAEHFKDSQLSIFVSLILKYLLNCNRFPSFSDSSLIDDSKRSIANNLFSIVC